MTHAHVALFCSESALVIHVAHAAAIFVWQFCSFVTLPDGNRSPKCDQRQTSIVFDELESTSALCMRYREIVGRTRFPEFRIIFHVSNRCTSDSLCAPLS